MKDNKCDDDTEYKYEKKLLANQPIIKHYASISDAGKLKKYIRNRQTDKLSEFGIFIKSHQIGSVKKQRDFYIQCIPYMVEKSRYEKDKILDYMLYIDNKGAVMSAIRSTWYLGISSALFTNFYIDTFEEFNSVKIFLALFFYVIMIYAGFVFIKSTVKDNNSNYYFTDEFELDYIHEYLFEDTTYHDSVIANNENNVSRQGNTNNP